MAGNFRRSNKQTISSKNQEVLLDDNTNEDEEMGIDLGEVFSVIKKKFFLLLFVLILFGGVALAGTMFLIPKTYESSSSIFLTPLVADNGVVDYNSQSSNEKLVNNVMSLLTKDNILSEVAKECGLDDADAVRDYLSITNETDTTIVTVSATTKDPKLSKNLANSTVNIFISKMKENLNLKNIEIVDEAKLSYEPAGPSILKNTLIGIVVGVVIDDLYVSIKVLTNNRLKSKEEAEKYLKLPVFCELPVIKE